jgi:hydrogenase expression/formation protein HypC
MCLAVPGQILHIDETDSLLRLAVVRFGEIEREASLACVPAAREGDFVLVHVGFAIGVLDPIEAQRTLEFLRDALDSEEIRDDRGGAEEAPT